MHIPVNRGMLFISFCNLFTINKFINYADLQGIVNKQFDNNQIYQISGQFFR